METESRRRRGGDVDIPRRRASRLRYAASASRLAPVVAAPLPAWPRLTNLNPDPAFAGAATVPLADGATVLGSGENADGRVRGAGVADRHAVVCASRTHDVVVLCALLVRRAGFPSDVAGMSTVGSFAVTSRGDAAAATRIFRRDDSRRRRGRDADLP